MATKKIARGTRTTKRRGNSLGSPGKSPAGPKRPISGEIIRAARRAGLFEVPAESTTSYSLIEAVILELSFGLMKTQGSIIRSLNKDRDYHLLSALDRLEQLQDELRKIEQPILRARGDRNRARIKAVAS